MGPIHELKCIFNTIYVDMLHVGKRVACVNSNVPMCKEVSANHCFGNSLKKSHVGVVFRGKLMKS